MTKIVNSLLSNRFFLKNGIFSKTAVILTVTWAFVLFKYLLAPCIFDLHVFGFRIYWPIVFNWPDAAAITTAASTLYFAVHNYYRSDGRKNDDKLEK
jgi:hypothetical protein